MSNNENNNIKVIEILIIKLYNDSTLNLPFERSVINGRTERNNL